MSITMMGWIFLGLGFVPFRISRSERSQKKGKRVQHWCHVQIQAAFWSLQIEQGPQGQRWRLSLPLVVRLKSAIWVAVKDLIR